MAHIRPFNALVYNQEKIKDLSNVICPPYDIISPARQQFFHSLSPYNLIHMELAFDNPEQDKYERAGNYFRELIKKEIIVRDPRPAIYFYSQEYSIKGEKKSRAGFFALLKIEEKKSTVFGHEHTHLEPKEDRLRLIRQVKANLSPIFVIFSDKKKAIPQTLLPLIRDKKPFIDCVDDEKIVHKVWRIDDPDILEKVSGKMEQENIFIADGHHRYEVAVAYRDEMKSKGVSPAAGESMGYVLAYFTNIDSLGLTVLPIHRLARLAAKPGMRQLFNQLSEYFSVEEVRERARFFFLLAKAGVAEHVIGMYTDGKFWLLRLRNVKVLDKLMSERTAEYRSLDVSILNAIVLEKILNLDLQDKNTLTYSAQADEICASVDADSSRIGFFVNPTKVEQIIAVALKGEKMPPKSTYFYPKVASGLVINKLD